MSEWAVPRTLDGHSDVELVDEVCQAVTSAVR